MTKRMHATGVLALLLGGGLMLATPAAAQTKGSPAATSAPAVRTSNPTSKFPNSAPIVRSQWQGPYGVSGESIVPRTQYMSAKALYARAMRFAECAKGDSHVDLILRTSIGSQDEAREIGRFFRAKPRCRVDAELLSPWLVRAALAEVALTRDGGASVAPGEASRLRPAVEWKMIVPRVAPSAPTMLITATNVAACHASAAPATARAVLATKPGSAQEKSAEAALFAAAPACAGASRPDTYTPVVYRALLASVIGDALLDPRDRRG